MIGQQTIISFYTIYWWIKHMCKCFMKHDTLKKNY